MRATLLTTVFLASSLFFPTVLHADSLININTADAALLDTLPGIGATKAQAVVDYRTQHGLFAQISDMQNVTGIGASTYAEIEPFITVGEVSAADSNTDASATTTTTTQTVTYHPPPSGLTVVAGEDVTLLQHAPHTFHATIKTTTGGADSGAEVRWSFGDGTSATGNPVVKTFSYAGTYLVTVQAKDGNTEGSDMVQVTVVPAVMHIDSVSSEGVMIANDSVDILDLSKWRIVTDYGFFTFPEGTELLGNTKVLFSWGVLGLPVAFSARVVYPGGVLAASFSPIEHAAVMVQPVMPTPSSSVVKTNTTVAITSQPTNTHEAAGALAPAPTTEVVGAGAPQSELSDQVAGALPQAEKAGLTKLISSPWSFGFLGVLAVSVGAFILL